MRIAPQDGLEELIENVDRVLKVLEIRDSKQQEGGVLCKPRYEANAELSLCMSKRSGVTLFVLTHSNSQL
jgi:hypothetical protein